MLTSPYACPRSRRHLPTGHLSEDVRKHNDDIDHNRTGGWPSPMWLALQPNSPSDLPSRSFELEVQQADRGTAWSGRERVICSSCRDGQHHDCDDSQHHRDYPSCACQHRPRLVEPSRNLTDVGADGSTTSRPSREGVR